MIPTRRLFFLRALVVAACLAIALAARDAAAQTTEVADGATLRAEYDALKSALDRNEYKRPLHLKSTQSSGDLRGDVHAVIDYPFATVSAALSDAPHWCDILILHLNTKYCRASGSGKDALVALHVGRKFEEPLDQAPRVEFNFRVDSSSADYLRVGLDAASGPYGTSNYRIRLEAIPLDSNRTFIHLTYAYGFGLSARLGLQAYLSTLGSGKVGFTVVERTPEGKPVYIGGVRGALERNAMRYYLAIDAYLASLKAPPQQQAEQRLRDWFAATERYALQLHELEENEYLDMKRNELRRQRGESS